MEENRRRLTGAFLAAEGVLYLSFLWLDSRGGGGTTGLKYAGVLLCLTAALVSAARGGDRKVAAALCLTAAADALLLVLDTCYALGVLLFLGVQLLYLCRLRRADGGRWLPGLRGGVLAFLLAALWALGLLQPLNVLSVVYFSMLLCNVVQALRDRSGWRGSFGLGLLLFACCDLCVGAFNSPGLVPDGLYSFARVGMWLFYLPSQVLIVLSGFPEKKEREHERE